MAIHARFPSQPPHSEAAQEVLSKCTSWSSACTVQLAPAEPLPRPYFSTVPRVPELVSREEVEATLQFHPKYKPILTREAIHLPQFVKRWADSSDLAAFQDVQLAVLNAEKALAEQTLWRGHGACVEQLERQLVESRLDRARWEVQVYSQAIANAAESPRVMFVRPSTDVQMEVDTTSSPLSMSPDSEFDRMSDLGASSMSSLELSTLLSTTLDEHTPPDGPIQYVQTILPSGLSGGTTTRIWSSL